MSHYLQGPIPIEVTPSSPPPTPPHKKGSYYRKPTKPTRHMYAELDLKLAGNISSDHNGNGVRLIIMFYVIYN